MYHFVCCGPAESLSGYDRDRRRPRKLTTAPRKIAAGGELSGSATEPPELRARVSGEVELWLGAQSPEFRPARNEEAAFEFWQQRPAAEHTGWRIAPKDESESRRHGGEPEFGAGKHRPATTSSRAVEPALRAGDAPSANRDASPKPSESTANPAGPRLRNTASNVRASGRPIFWKIAICAYLHLSRLPGP